MKRFSRAALALALLLTAPGLAPYRAAAQTMSGRAASAAPGAPLSVPGALGRMGTVATALPAANLSPASLAPGLTPAPSPAVAGVAVLGTFATPAPANDGPLLSARALPARAPGLKAAPAAAPAAAVLAVSAARVGAASAPGSPATPDAELGALFEGSAPRPSAVDVSLPAASAGFEPGGLEPAGAREPAKGPRWVEKFNGDPGPSSPRTSVKRTLAVGFLAAVVPMAITMAAVAVASAFGYVAHPNYSSPLAAATPTLVQALALWIGAAIMAPVSEEAIFRGALQGGSTRLLGFLGRTFTRLLGRATNPDFARSVSDRLSVLSLASVVVPGVVVATLFVALHETSDPLLFSTRLVQALVWAYVYRKEGILSTMVAHGVFNGLLALTVVFTAAGAPLLILAAAPLSLWGAIRAARFLKAQRPDVRSGALKPVRLSGMLSMALGAVLLAGYALLMPNVFWLVGAVLLKIDGLLKLRAGK